jgi:hypothetical protein
LRFVALPPLSRKTGRSARRAMSIPPPSADTSSGSMTRDLSRQIAVRARVPYEFQDPGANRQKGGIVHVRPDSEACEQARDDMTRFFIAAFKPQ